MKVSIVIPNWNGSQLLKKNLPSVLAANPNEVIVVDDGSQDDSLDILKKYKSVKVIRHTINQGFVVSVNDGVKEAKGDVVALLNNDVSPSEGFLQPLLDHFEKDSIFAVSCAEEGYSWAWAKFENGFITHGMGEPTSVPHSSFWASGGSAAFSRTKWLELGGMDALFAPFYWEDIDICYRAQKRGWKILWEPESKVVHDHESTIGKYFPRSYMDYVSLRNQLLFIWKNITSPKLSAQHQKALLKKLTSGRMWRPFLGCFTRLPAIFAKRRLEKKETKISDEEIFDKFTS